MVFACRGGGVPWILRTFRLTFPDCLAFAAATQPPAKPSSTTTTNPTTTTTAKPQPHHSNVHRPHQPKHQSKQANQSPPKSPLLPTSKSHDSSKFRNQKSDPTTTKRPPNSAEPTTHTTANLKSDREARNEAENESGEEEQQNISEEGSESISESSSISSASMEEEESWIASFCNVVGHEYFAEVAEDFIEDDFNLTGLGAVVPMYVCSSSNPPIHVTKHFLLGTRKLSK